MKQVQLLLITIFSALASQAFAQPFETPDELAEAYVDALKKKRTTEFENLYTSDSTILTNFSNSLGFDMERNLLSDFSDVVTSGIEMGIDWSKIKFIKAEYITRTDGPFVIAHPTVIIFKHRLFRYAIEVNATKIGKTWSLVPIERDKPVIYLKKN